jgi:TolB protein
MPSGTLFAAAQPGTFEGSGDVGTVLHKGSVEYDPAADSYLITGSGENMWAQRDPRGRSERR